MAGTTPPETAIGTIKGSVFGGRTGVAGAAVYLYAAGTTGYGSASTSLLTAHSTGNYPTTMDTSGNYYVTTDANGGFNFTGEYTCTSGTQIYVYAVGGNPGGGVNSAAGFLGVLGQCPASGSLASSISYININEVSTIAAAYALSGFAVDAVHVGVPTSTTPALATLEATNIANAFATAGNLFNIQSSPATGSFATTTPNGNGTLPTTKLNALANSLAACIDSAGPSSTQCSTLLGDALSGGTSGTTPTDTASAVINIAHNPTANVSGIFGVAPGTGNPYNTAIATAPNDWTLHITYTGGGIKTPKYIEEGYNLAIDGSGNVWIANYSTSAATLSKFSNLGVPEGPTSTTAYAVGKGASAVTVDANGNVWTANYSASTLSEVVPTGVNTATITTVTPSGLSEPNVLAFDGSGNMFIAEGNNEVMKATSAGVLISSTTAKQNGLAFPEAIAVEPGASGGVWAANESADVIGYFTNGLATTSEYTLTNTGATGAGVAIDATGNAWVAVYPIGASGTISGAGSIVELTTANVPTTFNPASNNANAGYYDSIAVDGGNNVWATDVDNGFLYEINATTGTVLSGTHGFLITGNTVCTATCTVPDEPQSVAIDGSGNVWYEMLTDSTVREMVGGAVPTITPLAYATANSLDGQRP